MKKRSGLIILFIVLICRPSYGQLGIWQTATKEEITDAYQIASSWLINTPSYFFKLKYTSYSDHITKIPVESSNAYYKRVTNSFRMEALGIKTIQNSKVKFVVDTANSSVTAMSPSTYSVSVANSEELNNMLSQFKALKKMKVSNSSVRYRIDFKENRLYESYEFSINSKGLLEDLKFYYSSQENKEDEQENVEKNMTTKLKPRLEIVFYDYQVPAQYSQSEFSDPQITVGENGKIDLKGDYREYRLLDYRLKK